MRFRHIGLIWLQGPEYAVYLTRELRSEMRGLMGELGSVSEGTRPALVSTSHGHHAVGFFNELLLRATSFLISERAHHDELLFTLVSVPVRFA